VLGDLIAVEMVPAREPASPAEARNDEEKHAHTHARVAETVQLLRPPLAYRAVRLQYRRERRCNCAENGQGDDEGTG
jgi:hypothetical protein